MPWRVVRIPMFDLGGTLYPGCSLTLYTYQDTQGFAAILPLASEPSGLRESLVRCRGKITSITCLLPLLEKFSGLPVEKGVSHHTFPCQKLGSLGKKYCGRHREGIDEKLFSIIYPDTNIPKSIWESRVLARSDMWGCSHQQCCRGLTDQDLVRQDRAEDKEFSVEWVCQPMGFLGEMN